MELSDSQYENELLNQIAEESPTFSKLLQSSLKAQAENSLDKTWLTESFWFGTLVDEMPTPVQVQLIITDDPTEMIDED